MEDTVAVRLIHARVDEEAGVAQLSDLLRQELHPCDGIAKDDGLVDLQFRKEGVEAVHLLPLLYKRIKLCHTLQRQLVHQIDFMGIRHVLVLELDNRHWECCRVHEDLSSVRQELQEILNNGLELWAQQFVCLIHDKHIASLQVAHVLVGKIQHTARRRHHNVHCVVKAHDILAETGAASGDHALHIHVLTKLLDDGGGLEGELTSGDEDEALDLSFRCRALLKQRNCERTCLARSILCSCKNRLAGQSHRDAVFLDW
mmetsp:Transcript_102065/g.186428  ORF Transcript_102065/g.186428 Transcript_102065/m.186428 type:complete len:258 (-) Transcript_102065:477-1250(-)